MTLTQLVLRLNADMRLKTRRLPSFPETIE